jgi:hypothetical protein
MRTAQGHTNIEIFGNSEKKRNFSGEIRQKPEFE